MQRLISKERLTETINENFGFSALLLNEIVEHIWSAASPLEVKRRDYKSHDLKVSILSAGKVEGGSSCCQRKPSKLIAFTHRDDKKRRVTRFIGICKTHFDLLK